MSLWRGDENAQDSVGTNHGMIVGGVTYAPGLRGAAFQLDGSSGYLRIADHESLHFTNALTVEMWFKRDNAGSYGALIDKRNWSRCNYGILMSADWRFQVYYDDPDFRNSSGAYEISFSAVPSAGVFHHVAGTFQQIDASHVQIKTYLDGQCLDTTVWPGRLANTLNADPLAIGSARDGSGSFFQGVIDEVALYDRALAASEVYSNYLALAPFVTNSVPATNCVPTNSVPYANAAGQVALWSGEEDALDSVGSNHGALLNGAAFAPGVRGQGFLLDGVDDYIRIPDSASLHLANELSLSLWFKRDNAGSYGALIDKRNWSRCNYGILMSADWRFQVYYDDPDFRNSSGAYEISFSAVPAPGVFHFLVGTYRQLDTSHVEVKTYLDGQLVQTDSLPGNLGNTFNSDALAIGCARDGAGSFFRGIIDEVTLYNYALRPSEVVSNYARFSIAPQIVTPPQSLSVIVGGSAAFSVTAIGAAPLQFQWQFNGDNLVGATNRTLEITSSQPANAGSYTVVVANDSGSVTSSVAVLVLTPDGLPPTFTVAPLALYRVSAGGTVTLGAEVSGTPPLWRQWTFNGVAILGATNDSLVLNNLQPENGGTYRLLVTNEFGSILSAGSAVEVSPLGGGGRVEFANFSYNRVFDSNGVTPVPTNAGYVAQLCVGVVSNSLTVIGNAANFVLPGRFHGGARYVEFMSPGAIAYVQVRVWDSGVSSSYDEAVLLGAKHGSSSVFTLPLGGGIIPPALLNSMPSFSLEPGTGAAPRRSLVSRTVARPCLANFTRGPKDVSLDIAGSSGGTYAIEISEDLVNWNMLTYIVTDSGALHFTDSEGASAPKRFYRARLITP